MRLLTVILLILAAFPLVAATDTVKIQTQVYCDHCKVCESCWGRMEHNLKFTKGVKELSYDETAMTIVIIYDPKKTNPAKLRKVISRSGFDADEVKADAKAREKLDTCCKKKG